MKRLLLISLAVLLAVSLSITIFPAHSVEAVQHGGLAFHISAEGEGEYQFLGDSEWQPGEFSINVAGQKGWNYKRTGYSRGYGTPQDTVQGHISGSFGEHEIKLTLMNPTGVRGPFTYNDYVKLYPNGKLESVGFKAKGTYDGNKVIWHQSYIRVFYDENWELDYILADLCFTDGTTQTFLDVKMYDASVDLHGNPN